jgi:hypothetical protein
MGYRGGLVGKGLLRVHKGKARMEEEHLPLLCRCHADLIIVGRIIQADFNYSDSMHG